MQALVTGILITVASSVANTDVDLVRLKQVMENSDVVVTGVFPAEPKPLRMRRLQSKWMRYDATFRIARVLKDSGTVEHRAGQEIRVHLLRPLADEPEEAFPLTTEREYLVFLKHNARNNRRPYITADPQLGVMAASAELVDQLVRLEDQPDVDVDQTTGQPEEAASFDPLPLAVAHTEQLDVDLATYKLDQGNVATYAPEKGPVRWLVVFESREGKLPLQIAGVGRSQIWRIEPLKLQPHVTTHPPSFRNLTGRWRMSLPAGYEHDVTLASVGHDFYVLAPTRLNMGGVYIRDDDRLVSLEEHGRKKERFVWEVRSAHLQTLVESVDAYGATYDHAVLFRPRFPEGENE